MSGFDRVAGFYDRLARLVYGKAIVDAQTCFLSRLSSSRRVLVLGGGSGWWLPQVLKLWPNIRIVYVELSQKMLELAKTRVQNQDQVSFVHGTVDLLQVTDQFDAVITFFYLDLFDQKIIDIEIQKIARFLTPNSRWLAADFVKVQWWHGPMLFLMYRFFRFTTGLNNQHLPDWSGGLQRHGLKQMEVKKFFKSFIEARVYAVP